MKSTIALIFGALMALSAAAGAADAYTADRHVKMNVPCEACHGTAEKSAPVRKAACLACHGSYEKVAERTKDVKPNSHYNHFGERDCSTCHKGHEPSTLTCNECHKFDLKTP